MNAIKAERGALAEQRKALRENERALKDKARNAERGLKVGNGFFEVIMAFTCKDERVELHTLHHDEFA